MFTFSEMLALVESERSFGAYVCHRRPGGPTATSDLVLDLRHLILFLIVPLLHAPALLSHFMYHIRETLSLVLVLFCPVLGFSLSYFH